MISTNIRKIAYLTWVFQMQFIFTILITRVPLCDNENISIYNFVQFFVGFKVLHDFGLLCLWEIIVYVTITFQNKKLNPKYMCSTVLLENCNEILLITKNLHWHQNVSGELGSHLLAGVNWTSTDMRAWIGNYIAINCGMESLITLIENDRINKFNICYPHCLMQWSITNGDVMLLIIVFGSCGFWVGWCRCVDLLHCTYWAIVVCPKWAAGKNNENVHNLTKQTKTKTNKKWKQGTVKGCISCSYASLCWCYVHHDMW